MAASDEVQALAWRAQKGSAHAQGPNMKITTRRMEGSAIPNKEYSRIRIFCIGRKVTEALQCLYMQIHCKSDVSAAGAQD